MKRVPRALILFLLLPHFSAYAQSDSSFLIRTVGSLQKQTSALPVEKVYLHLDRPHYAMGDTIWFKAYTVIGEHHQLSALSGVLYAELVSPADSVIKRLILPLISGTAWGDFALPRSYKPGSYHIRAYTNWMRNLGAQYFYNHAVQIGGIPFTIPAKQAAATNPDVQFFPEGGRLVNGIRSRVAVKAVDVNGLGEEIRGTVEDNQGNIVADFATRHLGMGVFALTPQSGKTYKAKISVSGEAAFTVDLPKASEEGYTLAVNNSAKDSIYVRVAVNEKLFAQKQHTPFYLVAQSGGKVYYTAAGRLESPVFTSKIEKSRFPSGILQFTLFSDSGEPMNERIAFIQNNDTLKLKLSAAGMASAPRQQVKFSLVASGGDNKPIPGSFSVAVINESRTGTDEGAESTIFNDLLLTSELKGTIEQPNYYFTDTNEQTSADLDDLMLTQGYRRFDWKETLNGAAPAITYLPERSLELVGTLKTPSGTPVPNGKVTLVSTRENLLKDTTTDVNGNFKFNNLYLSDTSKIVLRARKAHNGSNVAIYVKQPDYPMVIKEKETGTMAAVPPELAAIMKKNYAEYQQDKLDDSLKNKNLLKEVVIKNSKLAKPDIYNRYGTKEEHFVDMKKLQGYPSVENALHATQLTMLLPFKGNTRAEEAIPVIIDGLPFHLGDLYAYTPEEIESVGIISGILPADSALIVVTTKRSAGTDTTVLKQVTIRANKIKKAPDLSNSSNLHGGGNADQVIMGDKLGSCINLADCLIGKIKFNRNIKGMSVIVDGAIMDSNYISEVNPNDVYSIELLWSGPAKALYGSSISSAGAIVITMKRGAEGNKYNAAADTTVLKQVNIKAAKIAKKPALTNSSNLHGGGNADQVIMGDKLGLCINLADCLIGKVFGVRFGSDGSPISTRANGGTLSVIVDGIVLDGKRLNEVNSNDIYSIEVLRTAAARSIYGTSIQGGGALVITMKHGGEENKYNAAADTTVLKQVNIKAAKIAKKPELTNSSNLNGAGNANQVIMGDKIEGCIRLSDCLNGKIFGVKFDKGGIPYSIRTGARLGQGSGYPPPPMVLIVDGNIIDADHLDELNPNDIYSIEVLRSGAYLAIYGSNAPGGALVITSKRGGETNYVTSTVPAGLITYPFKGFYKARTFYSPKYTAAKTTRAPDLRNTIYWNPNVITNKDGAASFEYFNADTKGTYRVVVEGIDDNGNLGRQVYRYKVE